MKGRREDTQSQVARAGSICSKTSIDRRPCDVARMTFGSMLYSLPILYIVVNISLTFKALLYASFTNLCQCLTTAFVESISVPSMSERIPENVHSKAASPKTDLMPFGEEDLTGVL